MSFDTSWNDGLSISGNDSAALSGATINPDGTFTLDGSTYGGAFSDLYGTDLATNIATTTLHAYNATLAPGIITFQYTNQDGSMDPVFGGEVLAWDADAILVEQSNNFVAINPAAGTFSGTFDPHHIIWFSAEDISFNANGGNGPNFPITFGISGNKPNLAPCFVAGTVILTPDGAVAVEALRPGHVVEVVDAGRWEPVVWIGHRTVDCTQHLEPHKVWPVRVSANALGPGRPLRDLFLSPDHAVFVGDVLIPAKCLVNGTSIAQVRRATVTYYHVELARHAVLLAEGLPAESYLDIGDRANFADGDAPVRMHPDFASRVWDARGCAPLVVTGPELEAARSWINSLARGRVAGTAAIAA